MAIRIKCDTHPNWPPEETGGFGGWLRGTNGHRATLYRGAENVIDIGLFTQGVFPATNPWTEAWVEVKNMRVNGDPPTQADPAVFSQGALALDVTSIGYWNSGLSSSASIRISSTDADLLTAGSTAWMILSMADGAGTNQATIAAGRVSVI
jgi:hypothetical protein